MAEAGDRDTLYAFRRNLVVAASAGTGKTHALVGVLVHLALGVSEGEGGGLAEPVALDRIVATTFSRKAAAEIRARLVLALTRLASADPEAAYLGDLARSCDRLGVPRLTADALGGRARRALEGVAAARIGTLHGFAATIVRAHGVGLGWAPGFTVESEDDTRERSREAASASLEELLAADEPAARSIVRLAGGIDPCVDMLALLVEQIAEDGREPATLLLPEEDARAIEATMDALAEHARGLAKDELLGSQARALSDAWASGDPDRVEDAASELSAVAARGKCSDRARAFFDFRAELPGSTHADRGRNLARLWSARHGIVATASTLRGVLTRAEARCRESMVRDASLGYGEVLRAARDVLARDPAARRELAARTSALLVDEFQDTSRVQREIVELAWRDPGSLDDGAPSIARVRKQGLLIVGDRKQSIYAFRGADVGSFAELCIGLAGKPARDALRVPPGRVWEPEEPVADFVALRTNRRSSAEILSFVNAYSRIRLVAREPAELYEVEYAPSIEDLSVPHDAPRPAGRSPRVAWIPVPTAGKVVSTRPDDAEVVARRIGQILVTSEPRVGGAAPRPKDIAVLAGRNAMLDATAHALARAGIPYVVAGNGFFSAREVKDMLDMLAFIVDPVDAIARVSVLRGVWCGARDESLVGLTDPATGVPDVGAWRSGDRRRHVRSEDWPRIDALREVVLGLREASATIGPAETLRQAARALDLEETLILLPRGVQRVANVRKLMSLAEKEHDARAFLARVRRACDEERPEPEAATFSEDDDAVRLLTVHASKGLDFPIVFVPEAGAHPRGPARLPVVVRLAAGAPTIAARALDRDGRPHDTPSFAEAQIDVTRREVAEWSRLAYVAATRARHALFFVGDRRPPKGAVSEAYRCTAVAALTVLADSASGASPLLDVEPAPEAPPAPERPDVEADAPSRPGALALPREVRVSLRAGELADFAVCPRRFELAHVLGLPEAAGRTRAELAGAAAAAYASRRSSEGAAVTRDRAYLVRASSGGTTATIEGTIDVWVEGAAGSTEAIVVATEPDGAPTPRTDRLAAIAALAFPEGARHRTGVLAARASDPSWRPFAGALGSYGARQGLLASARECVEARLAGTFPRVDLATCDAIGCGYVSLCHPSERRQASSTDIPPTAR